MQARIPRANPLGLSFGRRNVAAVHDNRRRDQRFRFATFVLLLDPQNRFSATTIDVSDSGARIRLDRPVILRPDCLFSVEEFDIVVPSLIVWRSGLELGVRFVSGHPSAVQDQSAAPCFGRRQPPPREARTDGLAAGRHGGGPTSGDRFGRGGVQG